jgi:hypothetical protein
MHDTKQRHWTISEQINVVNHTFDHWYAIEIYSRTAPDPAQGLTEKQLLLQTM